MASAHTRRVAIATSFTYEPPASFPASCGLVKWCFSSRALALVPGIAGKLDTVVFTNNATLATADCGDASPAVRIDQFPSDLVELATRFAQAAGPSWVAPVKDANSSGAGSSGGEQWHRPLSRPTSRRIARSYVLKWHVVSRIEYDAIILTDSDVDLFTEFGGRAPHALGLAWWRSLERFIADTSVELAAGPDHAAPINTGMLLIRPSLETYALGLRALNSLRWNTTHGFGLSGKLRPRLREAIDRICARQANGSHMQEASAIGATNADATVADAADGVGLEGRRLKHSALPDVTHDVCDALNRSQAMHANTWSFVAGDSDQGLFTHVYLAELRGRTFAVTSPPVFWNIRRAASANVIAALRESSAGAKPQLASAGMLSPGPSSQATGGQSAPTRSSAATAPPPQMQPLAGLPHGLCAADVSPYKQCCTSSGRMCGTPIFPRHFWSGAKPWRTASPPCLKYFAFLSPPSPILAAASSAPLPPPRNGSGVGACLAFVRKRHATLLALQSKDPKKANSGCGSPMVSVFPVL